MTKLPPSILQKEDMKIYKNILDKVGFEGFWYDSMPFSIMSHLWCWVYMGVFSITIILHLMVLGWYSRLCPKTLATRRQHYGR